jgi:hypothetical protein
MNGRDEAIRGFLDRSIPLPATGGCDWDDVLARSRAAGKAVRTRRLVVAVAIVVVTAVVLAATPLGAMIANGFGSFSSWLSGSAGSPVTGKQKSAFIESTRKSWLHFPRTASLRKLVDTTTEGVRYQLFGFKVGDSLCLRMIASGAARSANTGCVPRSELKARREPALPIEVDVLIVKRERRDKQVSYVGIAAVTFGVVSDGVRRVEARTRSRVIEGIVKNDSFLLVNSRVKKRIRSMLAVDCNGRASAIKFAPAEGSPLLVFERPKPSGYLPHAVERTVRGIRIGWIERREPRGEPIPHGHHRFITRGDFPPAVFSRLIMPDPHGLVKMLVGLRLGGELCVEVLLVGQADGSSCTTLQHLASPKNTLPFFWGESYRSSTDQYELVTGMTGDVVARLTMFLSTGAQIPVPINDNAFAIQAPRATFPGELVAYDRRGRVIGISP